MFFQELKYHKAIERSSKDFMVIQEYGIVDQGHCCQDADISLIVITCFLMLYSMALAIKAVS